MFSNMEKYLLWLSSAVTKASGDDDTINEEILLKTISDCYNRVKVSCESDQNNNEYLDFRIDSSLVLLFCSPIVRNSCATFSSEEFLPMLRNFPLLDIKHFYMVNRSQKNYRFLRALFSYLPNESLYKIIPQFFACTKEVTAVTLAMLEQLLACLLFNEQFESNENLSNKMETFEKFIIFFKQQTVKTDTKSAVKISGYLFMYLMKCINHICSFLTGEEIIGPCSESSLNQLLLDAWNKRKHIINLGNRQSFQSITSSMLEICEYNVEAISVDVWIAWSLINLPVTNIVQVNNHSSITEIMCNAKPKTVQLSIAHNSFTILKLLNQNEGNNFIDLKNFKNLQEFLKQIAIDPDRDTDKDLSLEQLIEEILLKDYRQEKLLGFLITDEVIFSSEVGLKCIEENINKIPIHASHKALLRLINNFDSIQNMDKWIEVLLEAARKLPTSEIIEILETLLSSGLDERLKTPHFSAHLTAVFNQLVDTKETKTSSTQDQHVWLCLQSGSDVVFHAVSLAISLPGLVPIMVKTLAAIPMVCHSQSRNGNWSTLTCALEMQFSNGLDGQEMSEFVALTNGILNHMPVGSLVDPEEILNALILPNLISTPNTTVSILMVPISLLKTISEVNKETLTKSGPKLLSLIFTLEEVLHQSTHLGSVDTLVCLRLRQTTLQIMKTIVEYMFINCDQYKKEICLIRHLLKTKYNKLHIRGILPLLPIIENIPEIIDASPSDHILRLIVSATTIKQSHSNNNMLVEEDSRLMDILRNLTQTEWIWYLYKILPHCDKWEWLTAIQLVQQILFPKVNIVQPLLSMFYQMLCLVCMSTNNKSLLPDNLEHEEPSQSEDTKYKQRTKPISNGIHMNGIVNGDGDIINSSNNILEPLIIEDIEDMATRPTLLNVDISTEHCFEAFSFAAVEFVNEVMINRKLEMKISELTSICCFWCTYIPSLHCDSSLPLLLTARLLQQLETHITLYKELHSSRHKKLKTKSNKVNRIKVKSTDKDSSNVSKSTLNSIDNIESIANNVNSNVSKSTLNSIDNIESIANDDSNVSKSTLNGIDNIDDRNIESIANNNSNVSISTLNSIDNIDDLNIDSRLSLEPTPIEGQTSASDITNGIHSISLNNSDNIENNEKFEELHSIKQSLDKISFSFIKYVPLNSFSSIIVRKLQKLYEL